MSALTTMLLAITAANAQKKKRGRGRPPKHFKNATHTLLSGVVGKKSRGRPTGAKVYSDETIREYLAALDARIADAAKAGRHLSERGAITEWGIEWYMIRDRNSKARATARARRRAHAIAMVLSRWRAAKTE